MKKRKIIPFDTKYFTKSIYATYLNLAIIKKKKSVQILVTKFSEISLIFIDSGV